MAKRKTSLFLLLLGISAHNDTFGQIQDSIQQNIDQVVVTGQLKPTSLKNSVYKVRTITQDQIQRRATADITTLLNTELGIRFVNDMALGESDIELMGMSGQNVKVLLDGVPLLDRGATKQSLSQIDLNIVEKIEIVEGPLSVVYGTDALAGVINIITKNNIGGKTWNLHAKILEETASEEYSPFANEGKHNANIGISHQLDNWHFAVNGSRNTFGGWKGDKTGRALAWQPKEQWLGSVKIGLGDHRQNTWYRLDYANEDLYTPGDYNANNTYVDKNFLTDRYTHMLQSDWRLTDRLDLNGYASFQKYNRETVTKRTNLQTGETELTTGAGEQDVAKFDNLFFRGTAQYRFSNKLHAQAGVEYDRETGSGERLTSSSELSEYAAFVTAEYTVLSQLNIRPGLRISGNSVFKTSPLLPSLNAKLDISESVDLRLAYARGFRSPALRELFFEFFDTNHSIRGNKNLEPEYSNSFNGYLSFNKALTDDSHYYGSIGGFYNLFDNMIAMGADPENPSISTYLNIDKFKTTGMTWENNYQIRNIQIGLGLSYIGRYNTLHESYPDTDQFTWTPEINSTVSYSIPKWGTDLNVFYKFYGKRQRFQAKPLTSGDYEVTQVHIGSFQQADFTINKKIGNYLKIDAGVRNVFNTINVVNTGTVGESAHDSVNGSVPMSYGRSYFVGIQYQFSK